MLIYQAPVIIVGHGGSLVDSAPFVWKVAGSKSAFRPKGHGFDSRSSHHVSILGKSFTRSCL